MDLVSERNDSDDEEDLEALRIAALATIKSKDKLESGSPEPSTSNNTSSPGFPSALPPRKDPGQPNQFWKRGRGGFRGRGGGFPKMNQRSNLIVITPVSTGDADPTENNNDNNNPKPQLILPQHRYCQAVSESSSSPKTFSRKGPTRFNRHESGSESSDSDYDDDNDDEPSDDQDSYSNETILQDENSMNFAQLTPEESVETDTQSTNTEHRLSFQNANLEGIQTSSYSMDDKVMSSSMNDSIIPTNYSTLNDSVNRDPTNYSTVNNSVNPTNYPSYPEYIPTPSASYQTQQNVSSIPANGSQDYDGNFRMMSTSEDYSTGGVKKNSSVDPTLSQNDLRMELKKRMLKLRSETADLAITKLAVRDRDERRTSDDFGHRYSRDTIHKRSRSDGTDDSRSRNRSRSLTRNSRNRLRSPSPRNPDNIRSDRSPSPNNFDNLRRSRSPRRNSDKLRRSPSPRNTNRDYKRGERTSSDKIRRSLSPRNSSDKIHRSKSPRNADRDYNKRGERTSKRDYSRSPNRRHNREESSQSPDRNGKRSWSRSPVRAQRRTSAGSPARSTNKRSWSRSPDWRNNRKNSRSPERSHKRENSRSSERSLKRENSCSPHARRNHRQNSRSPFRSDKRVFSRSPEKRMNKRDGSRTPEKSSKHYYSTEQSTTQEHSKSTKRDISHTPNKTHKSISSPTSKTEKSSHSPYKRRNRSRSPDRTSRADVDSSKSLKRSVSPARNHKRNSVASPDKTRRIPSPPKHKRISWSPPPKDKAIWSPSPEKKSSRLEGLERKPQRQSPYQSPEKQASRSKLERSQSPHQSPDKKPSRSKRDRSRSPIRSHRPDSSGSPEVNRRNVDRSRSISSRHRQSRSSSNSSGSDSRSGRPVRMVSSVVKPVQSSVVAVPNLSSKDKREMSSSDLTISVDLKKRKDLEDLKPKAISSSIVIGDGRNNAADNNGKRLPVHMRLGMLPSNRLIRMTKDAEAAFVNTSSDENGGETMAAVAEGGKKKINFRIESVSKLRMDELGMPTKSSAESAKSRRKKAYR